MQVDQNIVTRVVTLIKATALIVQFSSHTWGESMMRPPGLGDVCRIQLYPRMHQYGTIESTSRAHLAHAQVRRVRYVEDKRLIPVELIESFAYTGNVYSHGSGCTSRQLELAAGLWWGEYSDDSLQIKTSLRGKHWKL